MAIRKRAWLDGQGVERFAWQVTYRDGAGKRRSRQFSRKKEADAWATDAMWDVARGIHTHQRDSVNITQASEIWLARAVTEGLERSTLKSYAEQVRLHINPLIGHQNLSRLNAPAVEKFRDILVQTRSKAMAAKVVQTLNSIINEAVRQGLVAHNVAKGVRVVRSSRERPPITIPTTMELRAMLAAASSDELPFILTAITTGMRSSELRGLLWQNVDLVKQIISITQRADHWGKIGPPKSAAGLRSIPIPPELAKSLFDLQATTRQSITDLVFPSRRRTSLRHNNVIRRIFIPLQMRAGITKPRMTANGTPILDVDGQPILTGKFGLHALRHAAASNWIASGVDLKRLQAWLGHASVQMTIDRYGHLMVDVERDADFARAATRGLLDA